MSTRTSTRAGPPKDFFYVMLRNPTPRDGSGVEWTPDGGLQPPPAWLPGIYTGRACARRARSTARRASSRDTLSSA